MADVTESLLQLRRGTKAIVEKRLGAAHRRRKFSQGCDGSAHYSARVSTAAGYGLPFVLAEIPVARWG